MKYKKRARPIHVIAPGIISGAEKVVQTGLTALHDIGLDPILIIIRETRAPHFADEFARIIPEKIKRIIVDSNRAFDLLLPFRMKEELERFLKNEKPGQLVFHSHGFKALIACSIVKGKYHHIHTHHGNTGHSWQVRLYEQAAFNVMKTCNRVIAVSHKMKEELLQELHPYRKISVIDNMLSFKNSAKIREMRKAMLYQFSEETLKLLYVGRLSPEKGLDLFLKCWASLIYRDRFELTIVGDGPLRAQIEQIIMDNHLYGKVKMYGHVPDPSEFYIHSDLLILPSLTEGLPMTLIESLASGVPVLANDVGAISSLIKHNHNGYICASSDSEIWSTALWEALKNVGQWKENAQQEASQVEMRFSPGKWAVKTQACYQVEV